MEYGLNAVPVTPSDTVDLIRPSQGSLVANAPGTLTTRFGVNVATQMACAVGGTVTYIDDLGNTLQITLVAGFLYPIRHTRIKATGTAATGIIAFFPINQ